MIKVILLIFMIFFHIWDDFGRQGILALMKQKSWWEEQKDYKNMYKNDYIIALLVHGFSWTVMIHIPIIFYYLYMSYEINIIHFIGHIIIFISTWILHCYIDDTKCNQHKINLIIDQTCHLIQIIALYFIVIYFG